MVTVFLVSPAVVFTVGCYVSAMFLLVGLIYGWFYGGLMVGFTVGFYDCVSRC